LAWKRISSPALPDEEGDRQALEEKIARLRRGETVTLLGRSGSPVWWRWRPRKMDAQTMQDMDEVFRVYAGKQPGLLELLPTAPKRFWFHAQVQHTDSRSLGRVGIYFAHGTRRMDEEAAHCCFRVTFNDRVALIKAPGAREAAHSEVALKLPVYREKKDGAFSCRLDTNCVLGQMFIPAGRAKSMPWRSLDVEVTPEQIKVFWEGQQITTSWGGQPVDSCDPREALRWACTFLGTKDIRRRKDGVPAPAGANMELALGSGLGLYVEQGVAAFRSVVIEPLPQQ